MDHNFQAQQLRLLAFGESDRRQEEGGNEGEGKEIGEGGESEGE